MLEVDQIDVQVSDWDYPDHPGEIQCNSQFCQDGRINWILPSSFE
jgi:hypothetical protein